MNLLYTSLEHFVMPSLKFILRIFRKSGEIIRVSLNLTKVKGVLNEDLGTFLIISLLILLRMINVSEESRRKKIKTQFKFFFKKENRAFIR